MPDRYEQILAFITALNRRRKSIELLQALFFALFSVLAAVLLITLIIYADRTGASDVFALLASSVKSIGLAVAIVVLIRFVFQFLKAPGVKELAVRVEEESGHKDNLLVSALELKREVTDPSATNVFSKDLALDTIDRAASYSLDLRAKDFASSKAAVVALAMLIVAGGIFLAALKFLPDEAMAAARFMAKPSLVPHKEELITEVKGLPLQVGDFKISYTYPAYTGFEPDAVEGADGDIEAIKGTEVTIEAKCASSLSSATLMLGNAELPVEISNSGRRLKIRFTLSEAGRYFFKGMGRDGLKYTEASSHEISMISDSFPKIEILAPATDMEVEELGEVTIDYRGQDDLGLGKVELVYRRAYGDDEERIIINKPNERERKVMDSYTMNLAVLSLNPGDRLSYHLEVLDNDNISGPKRGMSKTYYVKVFSPREEHDKITKRIDELFERLIKLLGGTLVDPENPDDKEAAFKNELVIRDQLTEAAEMTAEIAEAMRDDPLADYNFYKTINNMSKRLNKLSKKRQRRVGNKTKPGKKDSLLKKVAALKPAEIKEEERDVIALDMELKRGNVNDIISAMEELLAAQKRLQELMERVRNGDESAEAALKEEMKRIQELMQQIMRKMAEGRKTLPEEFINADAIKDMNIMSAFEQMKRMQELAMDGDLEAAMKFAEDLEAELARMMAAMKEGASQFGWSTMGKTLKELDEITEKISELEEKEKDVLEKTSDIESDLLEKMSGLKSDFIKEEHKKLEALKKLVKSAEKKADKLPSKGIDDILETNFQTKRSSIRYRLSLLNNPLMNPNLDAAIELLISENLTELLTLMKRVLTELNMSARMSGTVLEMYKPKPEKFAIDMDKGIEEAVALTEEIIRDMENLFQKSGMEALNNAQKKKLKKLAEKQKGIEGELKELMEKLEALKGDVPSMSDDPMNDLDGAKKAMGKAEGDLKGMKPSSAASNEGDALNKLGKAKKGLEGLKEGMMKGMKGGGIPMPMFMPGGGMPGRQPGADGSMGINRDDVEIPGKEQYKVPEEYREDILKAMKDAAPEKYKDLIKDYYERLIE